MGGKALAHYGAQRISKQARDFVQSDLVLLARQMGADCLSLIRELADKESFGDIDLLYTGDLDLRHLAGRPMVRNGLVTSTLFMTPDGAAQLDFVRSTPEAFDFAFQYYAFNDQGNLLGRIARMLGFSLGHKGLQYRYKDANDRVHKLHVTYDWAVAMELIGYGSRPETMTWADSVAYVESGRYFCHEPFLLVNRDHKGRTRDKKRESYAKFLEHLRSKRFSSPNQPRDLARLRQQLFDKACAIEPKLQTGIDALTAQSLRLVAVRAKLNGDIVKARTGLEGKQLGPVMAKLRQPGWEFMVEHATEAEIAKMIDDAVEAVHDGD